MENENQIKPEETSKEDSTKIQNPEVKEENLTMADFEDMLDKDALDAHKWTKFNQMKEEGVVIDATIDGLVKGGFIINVDDIRGFMPFSLASLTRISSPDKMLGEKVKVQISEVDRAAKRLILSARELLKQEEKKKRSEIISKISVGDIFEGKVDSVMDFGVFVKDEDGITGLVHVSQISHDRVKHPKDVLKKGDKVTAKVIKIADGKIGLSIKALTKDPNKEEEIKDYKIPEAESISTNLGALLQGLDIKE